MKKNQKEAIIKLLGGLGFLVLIVGMFTDLYEFLYGVIGAFAIWILSGVFATYFGMKKKKK